MDSGWTHAGASAAAAFLASLVESVEALTVVLAVGAVRGWRGSLTGAGLGLAVLLVLTAALGPALTRIPLDLIQLVVGGLLLLFGLRWLRKAILRAAGAIPLHDETAAKETAKLSRFGAAVSALDGIAVASSLAAGSVVYVGSAATRFLRLSTVANARLVAFTSCRRPNRLAQTGWGGC